MILIRITCMLYTNGTRFNQNSTHIVLIMLVSRQRQGLSKVCPVHVSSRYANGRTCYRISSLHTGIRSMWRIRSRKHWNSFWTLTGSGISASSLLHTCILQLNQDMESYVRSSLKLKVDIEFQMWCWRVLTRLSPILNLNFTLTMI